MFLILWNTDMYNNNKKAVCSFLLGSSSQEMSYHDFKKYKTFP